jgi:hypothetical protein
MALSDRLMGITVPGKRHPTANTPEPNVDRRLVGPFGTSVGRIRSTGLSRQDGVVGGRTSDTRCAIALTLPLGGSRGTSGEGLIFQNQTSIVHLGVFRRRDHRPMGASFL